MRTCCIVGCNGPDVIDPYGGTWPTCRDLRPFCREHLTGFVSATLTEAERHAWAKTAAARAQQSTEPVYVLESTP